MIVVLLVAVLLFSLIGLWALLFAPPWMWHPLGQCSPVSTNHVIAAHEVIRCKSYNAWSGSFSDISEVTLIFTAIASALTLYRTYRKHVECHEDDCSKRGKYVIEGGVRCCDDHHPALDERDEKDRGFVHKLHVAHLEHVDRQRAGFSRPARE